MPKLYTSSEFDPEESVAVVKKLDNKMDVPDIFVNLQQEALEKPPESKDDAQVNLSGDYYFSALPRKIKKKWPFCLYIAGKKGAGKSTHLANWANNYHVLCPKNPIYMISSKKEDPTIEKELGEDKIIRIPTEKFGDDSDHIPTIDDFEDTLICFDDFARDDNAQRIIHFMEVLAERGRQKNISLITVWHNVSSSHKTKLLLNESDYLLIFPKLLSNHNFRYFGQQYANIDDKRLLKKIKNDTGSHCLICTVPKYIVTPQSVYLPDHIFDD
eukprot:gb/GECG01009202.1/.p1 GENE.gb/GECG01009202.1/~~gb/GECG01009202.1/.p1  ORF type:complete len:271 (+),score=35.67 gb/GECG01009202.1/:1-813(+)